MPQSHITDGTVRKRQETTSSLFPTGMIAKLERTQSTVNQPKTKHKTLANNWNNNKQGIKVS